MTFLYAYSRDNVHDDERNRLPQATPHYHWGRFCNSLFRMLEARPWLAPDT
jgi:hypothetical protein